FPDLNAARTQVLAEWSKWRDGILKQLRFTRAQVKSWIADLNAAANSAIAPVLTILDQLNHDLGALSGALKDVQVEAVSKVTAVASAVDGPLSDAETRVDLILRPIAGGQADQIRQALAGARSDLQAAVST